MENFELLATHPDGSTDVYEFLNCREIVQWLIGSDVESVDELKLVLSAVDGKRLSIVVPNSDSKKLHFELESVAA